MTLPSTIGSDLSQIIYPKKNNKDNETRLHNIYNDLVASGFRVIETSPINQTPNIDVNMSSIIIRFNTDIATPVENLSGYITISNVGVLY